MLFKLALKDLLFDWKMSFCIMAAVASVIAPLLLLFSLRFGIVNSLETELKSNPLNLEIKMMSSYSLTPEFFNELRLNPHVGFAIEMTRSLSVTANIGCNGKVVTGAEVIPTGKGDPLVKLSKLEDELSDHEVYVSAALASNLNLSQGSVIKMAVNRKISGKDEVGTENFKVKGIINRAYLPRNSLLANLDVLSAMEDFKDGYNPKLFADGSYLNTSRAGFAKVRIYAKSLDDVEPLALMLAKKNFSVSDKSASIENVKAIDRVLSFVFFTIGITSVAGGVLALVGLCVTNTERKKTNYALLALTGVSIGKNALIAVLEYGILSTIAYVAALLLFFAGNVVFNLYFGNLLLEGNVSLLEAKHMLVGFILTLGVGIVTALSVFLTKCLNLDLAKILRGA